MYQILFSRSYLLSYIHLRKFDVIITQYSSRLTIGKMWIFSDRTSKWISKWNLRTLRKITEAYLQFYATVQRKQLWRLKTGEEKRCVRGSISVIAIFVKSRICIKRPRSSVKYFLSFPTIVCYFSIKPSILPLRKPERGDKFHYFTSKLDSLLMT